MMCILYRGDEAVDEIPLLLVADDKDETYSLDVVPVGNALFAGSMQEVA